jgi:hypothetical protein
VISMSPHLAALLWAMALLSSLGLPRDLSAQESEDPVRALAAYQVEAERFTELPLEWLQSVSWLRPWLEVEETPLSTSSLRVVRVTPRNASHARSVLVGVSANGALPLGGFDEIHLSAAAQALGRVANEREAVNARTRLLARLADPNGGTRSESPADGLSPETPLAGCYMEYFRAHPDTLVALDDEWAARISLVSAARSYGLRHDYVVFAFRLDAEGALLGWARQSVRVPCAGQD